MKSNIKYYRHEVGSHNHGKFKALRAQYGWAGEGKFWALNNLIGSADNCILDISKGYNKFSIASDLDFKPDEFDAFISYLHDVCELIRIEDGKITTDMVQISLEEANKERERDRRRKTENSKKNGNPDGVQPEAVGKIDIPTGKTQNSHRETVYNNNNNDNNNHNENNNNKKNNKKSSTIAGANAPVDQEKLNYNQSKCFFLEFYKENFEAEYYFEAKDGAKMKALLKKIEFQVKSKCKDRNEAFNPEKIPEAFAYFINQAFLKSDDWVLGNFNLSILDSKFNDIFNKIQNARSSNKQQQSKLSPAERAFNLYN